MCVVLSSNSPLSADAHQQKNNELYADLPAVPSFEGTARRMTYPRFNFDTSYCSYEFALPTMVNRQGRGGDERNNKTLGTAMIL